MNRGPVVLALFSLALSAARAAAQGVTTSAIAGRIVAAGGSSLEARVRIVHEATGFASEVRSARGRFLVQGLEPGGPYTVVVRALGFAPMRVPGLRLSLGERREVAVVLERVTARLDTIAVVARAGRGAHDDGGTGTTITDSLIERLPSLNRELHDFLRLVPQLSTKIGLPGAGVSAAGMNFRLNGFLINGVSERTLSGGVSPGVRSVPLDAVQEYQVLLSPYDVRYGDFAGALVNTVTKSGSNAFRGAAFAYGRTDRLSRGGDLAPALPYERAQYGFTLGGPIVRDRLHFFVAPEVQHLTSPAAGPYLGQPPAARPTVPLAPEELARFDAIMRSYGLTAGSAGPIENGRPVRSLFTRLDLALPAWNSRAILWHNAGGADEDAFSRAGAALDTFSLSSYAVRREQRTRTAALHLHTTFARLGGAYNELLLSRRADRLDAAAAVQQPIVRVSVPSLTGGRVTLNSGTHETAQTDGFRSGSWSLKDDFTLPVGSSHVVTVGAQVERFRIHRGNGIGSYGSWSFAGLDDFAAGIAERYDVRVGFAGTEGDLRGTQYAAYAGDRWEPAAALSVTWGLRADVLALDGAPPPQPLVDTLFRRRTNRMPRRRVELSPRLGFTWEDREDGRQRVRGGVGVFTGRYPLAWAHAAMSAFGALNGVVRCTSTGGALRLPPAFDPDPRSPPQRCVGGAGLSPTFRGDVDLLDPDLRMARVTRGSLAYERRLPAGLLLTTEAMATRALSDFVLVNLNLPDPVGTDASGRVMYGTIGPSGIAIRQPRSDYSEVVDLRNSSATRTWELTARLETTRGRAVHGFGSYTYSRARDAQTPLRVNTNGTTAWASARVVSGRHDDLSATRSSNDVPHRVVVGGIVTAPWRRAATSLALYYVGESGRPFTYVARGTLGKGDLNADGTNANDPIYVPRDAMDSTELLFSGVSAVVDADSSPVAQAGRVLAQRRAFGALVERTRCLREHRGRILERNACREPWSNTTVATLRQSVPIRERSVEVQLDVFNVLNLMNAGWGLRRTAATGLLEHVGQLADPTLGSRPVFRYDAAADWITAADESAFQLQLALRYRF